MTKQNLSIRLSEADVKLLHELVQLTGAYSISECVRDALRAQYRRVSAFGAIAPRVSEERIP